MSKKCCWRIKNLAEAWRLYKKLAAIPQSRIFNPVKKTTRQHFLRKQLTAFHCKKIKFSMKDFSSKSDHIRRKLPIWSHVLEKSFMENSVFCAVFILKSSIISVWQTSKYALVPTQPAFTWSNLTKETLEQGVKYVQS